MSGITPGMSPQEPIRVVAVSVTPAKVDNKPLYVVLKKDGKKVPLIDGGVTSGWRKWISAGPVILEQGSGLTVELLRRRLLHEDDQLAESKLSFDLLQSFLDSATPNQPIEYQIHPYPELRLSLDPGGTAPEMRLKKIVQKLRETPGLLERTGKWQGPLVTLLEVSTAISEAHPIAKAALATVNVVYRKLQAQDERLEQISALVENMAYMCRCIQEVKQTARSLLFEEAINDATPLITRIEKFITLWATSGAVDIFVNDSSNRELSELNKDYNTFRERFDRGIAMNSSAGVERVERALKHQDEKVEELVEDQKAEELLKKLLPKGIDGVLAATRCLEGTREDILESVDAYLDNFEESESNLLWIRGHPGVGKSTIASTIVSRLDARKRPALYFVFERAKAGITTPRALWCYVGYKLARWLPPVKQCITELLYAEEIRLNTSNSEDLFQQLVENPLNTLIDVPLTHPPVIVIDGLDECGGFEGYQSSSRRELLKTLKGWPRLSKKFKLVVTSRPEVDITTAFHSISLPIDLFSGEAVTPQTSEDIRTFLVHRFHLITEHHSELARDWPGKSGIDGITTRAAGLFVWAKTAVDFVSRGEPIERLQEVTSNRHNPGLRAFQILASTIILAKRPMNGTDCVRLFTNVISESMLKTFCNNLQSVLDQRGPLRFTHQSFVDFLLDHDEPHDCPEKFRIIKPREKRYLIDACIVIMSAELRFNICGLKTSTLPNVDVPGIEKKVEDNIPPHLSYSCCFWADHLSGVPFDKGLMKSVKVLVEEKFLYWLEAMSLLNELNRVDSTLEAILKWSKPANDEDFLRFVKDARRFVSAFRYPIAESTPHIYVSALPFAPQQSNIAQHFLGSYPRTITITSGKPVHWSPRLFVAEYHKDWIKAVVFSPDHHYFAYCGETAADVCDSENGNLISGPLHPSYLIDRIAFSPDGKRIALASWGGTVTVWGTESGKELLCFKGASPSNLNRVDYITYSHDSQKIASCSENTITVWDIESGTKIRGLFEGHGNQIVFSTDNQCVISGSLKGVVRFWYLDGRAPSRTKLHLRQTRLEVIALSPNGRFMAGGSDDGFISVWEIGGEIEPINVFKAHLGMVDWVTYSTNDEHSISRGPKHGTVGVDLFFGTSNERPITYSANGGRPISGEQQNERPGSSPTGNSFKEQHSSIVSITYSANGEYLVSKGVHEETLRVWNPILGQTVFQPLVVNQNSTTSAIAFSVSDLAKLAVGMRDGSVVMWVLDTIRVSPSSANPDSASASILDSGVQEGGRSPGVPTFPTNVHCIALSPCGKKLASGSDAGVCIWDTSTGEPLSKPAKEARSPTTNVIFSPDGKWIASLSDDGSICMWDALDWPVCSYYLEMADGDDFKGLEGALAFSRNSQTLVSCKGNRVRILEMGTLTSPVQYTIEPDVSTFGLRVVLSPDGTKIVLWWDGEDRPQIWSIMSQELIRVEGGADWGLRPYHMAFSPSGKLVYSVSDPRPELHVYDVATGDEIAMVSLRTSQLPTKPVFSPDDRFIILGAEISGGIEVFDISTRRIISGPWYGHVDRVRSTVFSQDGSKMASYSRDGMIRVWDTSDFVGSSSHSPGRPSNPFTDECRLENGWVKAPNGELLFWVPPSNRKGLYWPRNATVVGEDAIKPDLTKFEFGENWQRCRHSE